MQFLDHKNAMNVPIGEISQRLVEINGSLEEVNRTIDNLNVQISTFNSKQLVENERILGGGEVDPDRAKQVNRTMQVNSWRRLRDTAERRTGNTMLHCPNCCREPRTIGQGC